MHIEIYFGCNEFLVFSKQFNREANVIWIFKVSMNVVRRETASDVHKTVYDIHTLLTYITTLIFSGLRSRILMDTVLKFEKGLGYLGNILITENDTRKHLKIFLANSHSLIICIQCLIANNVVYINFIKCQDHGNKGIETSVSTIIKVKLAISVNNKFQLIVSKLRLVYKCQHVFNKCCSEFFKYSSNFRFIIIDHKL